MLIVGTGVVVAPPLSLLARHTFPLVEHHDGLSVGTMMAATHHSMWYDSYYATWHSTELFVSLRTMEPVVFPKYVQLPSSITPATHTMAFGWPVRCMYYHRWAAPNQLSFVAGNTTAIRAGSSCLPTEVLWGRLCMNLVGLVGILALCRKGAFECWSWYSNRCRADLCLQCGYDLVGLAPERRCPECGCLRTAAK